MTPTTKSPVDTIREALRQALETCNRHATNPSRLPQEVDHALCVEVPSDIEDAIAALSSLSTQPAQKVLDPIKVGDAVTGWLVACRPDLHIPAYAEVIASLVHRIMELAPVPAQTILTKAVKSAIYRIEETVSADSASMVAIMNLWKELGVSTTIEPRSDAFVPRKPVQFDVPDTRGFFIDEEAREQTESDLHSLHRMQSPAPAQTMMSTDYEALDLSPVTVHLTGPLSGVRHNIEHYERMHEYDITPESRKRTLDDLRMEENRLVEAIALLKSRPAPLPSQTEGLDEEWVKARAMEVFPPDEVNDGCPWYGHRRAIDDTAARTMIRHLHKRGYLSPPRQAEVPL